MMFASPFLRCEKRVSLILEEEMPSVFHSLSSLLTSIVILQCCIVPEIAYAQTISLEESNAIEDHGNNHLHFLFSNTCRRKLTVFRLSFVIMIKYQCNINDYDYIIFITKK